MQLRLLVDGTEFPGGSLYVHVVESARQENIITISGVAEGLRAGPHTFSLDFRPATSTPTARVHGGSFHGFLLNDAQMV